VAADRSSITHGARSCKLGVYLACVPIIRSGRPIRYWPSSVRSRIRQAASSLASRCAVEIGSPASLAISVSECTLPPVNVIKIAVTLLVTERPESAELPATK
jgi:hypothetical protein